MTLQNPTLISPIESSLVYGTALTFVFSVPSDTSNKQLVFRLELDTNSTISSTNVHYKKVESRFAQDKKVNGKWEVKNGVGSYIAMPTGGVILDYYGNDAKVTIRKQDTIQFPDVETTWYWRISASNMLLDSIYNIAVFGQSVFRSS
jgi:hypothetical protein